MTNQVESLSVGFADEVSAGAKAAEQAIKRVGDAAEYAEQRVTRAAKSGASLSRQYDEDARLKAKLADVTKRYAFELESLERSELSLAEKAKIRANILAQQEIATEKTIKSHERWLAGMKAMDASAGSVSAGMAAATATANSWAGALAKVYETASRADGAINQAAAALQAMNASFGAGHASFSEWSAAAKGLESSLRGVTSAQKAINAATGVTTMGVAPPSSSRADYEALWDGLADTVQRKAAELSAHAQRAVNAATGVQYWGTLSQEVVSDYEALWGRLLTEQEQGAEKLQRQTAADNARLAASYAAVMASIDPTVAAQQRYDKALADLRAGAAATGKSLTDLAADEAALAAKMSPAALAAKREADTLEQLRQRADPASAALRRLAEDQRALDVAYAANKITGDEYATLTASLTRHRNMVEMSTASVKAQTNALGLNRAQMQALTPQLNDVVSGLLMGQPPMMIFTQQSGQIVQALQAGGSEMPKFKASTLALAGGFVAAAAAAALVTYRMAEISHEGKRLAELSGRLNPGLSATAEQLRQISFDAAERGASRADAMAALEKVIGNTRITSAGLAATITKLSVDLSALKGGDVSEWAVKLSDAAGKGASAFSDMVGVVPGVTASTLEAARAAERMGDRVGALNMIFASVENAAGGAAKKMQGAWDTAIHDMVRSFDNMLDAIAKNEVIVRIKVVSAGAVSQSVSDTASIIGDLFKNPSLDSFSKYIASLVVGGTSAQQMPSFKTVNGDIDRLRREMDAARQRVERLEQSSQQQYGSVFGGALAAARADLAAISARLSAAERDIKEVTQTSPTEATKTITRAGASAGVATGYNGGLVDADINKLNEQSEKLKQQAQAATILGNAFGFSAKQAAENRVALAEMAISLGAAGAGYAKAILSASSMEAALKDLPQELVNLYKAMGAVSAARLNAELQTLTRTTMAEVEGANLLARAYGVSSEAVREAQIQQKALAEVARGAVEPYDAIVARLRQLDDAQRKVQAAQFDATLKQQTEDAQRLAAAWGQGANAAREAALANEVLAEARKRGLSANDTGEIASISQSVMAKDAAQRAASFAQMAAEQRKAVDLANAEFDMLGRSNAERAKAVAEMQAYNDLAAKGADMADAGTKAYIAQAGEIARVNSLLQDAASSAADITRPIATGLEDAIVGAKKLGDIFTGVGEDLKRIFVRMTVTKPLENWFSGTLTQMMAGGIQPVNNNTPAPANNADALAKLVGTVQGGLGSSNTNPMWVQVAGGAALPMGGIAASMSQPLPVAVADAGDIATQIRAAAQEYGVPEEVALAVGRIESNLRQYDAQGRVLTSSAGAQGVMQLMPGTAKWLGVDATNTQDNIRGGVKFLAMLGRQFGGNWDLAAAAYNAGPGTVQAWQRGDRASLPAETVTYLQRFGPATEAARQQIAQAGASTQQFASAVTQIGTRFAAVEQTAGGVTAAMEAQVAAQMDAVSATNRGVAANQQMSSAQSELVASVLGLSKSQRGAATAAGQFTAQQEDTIAAALRQVESMDAATGAAEDFDKRFGAASDGARTATESFARAQSQAANTTVNAASVMAQASQQAGLTMVSGTQQAMGSLLSIIGAASGVKGGGIPGQVIQAGGPQGISNSLAQLSGALGLNSAGDAFGGIKDFLNTPIFGSSSGVATGYVDTIGATQITNTPGMTGNGATWGDAIGAVGYGFNAFQNFSQGNVVGGIGNTAATVMSFIPGAQPFAPLVAIGSSLLGSLFGGGDVQYPMAWYDAEKGQTTGVNTLDGGDTSQLRQAGEQVQTALKQLATSLNVPVSSLPGGGFGTNPDGHPGTAAPQGDFWWSYAEGQGGWDAAKSAGSMEEAAKAYMLATLRGADLSGVDPLVKKALNSNVTDTDKLSSILSLAKQVADATAGLESFGKSLDDVAASAKKSAAAQFDALKEQASLADEGGFSGEFRSLIEKQIRAGFDPAVSSLAEMGSQSATITGQFDALREAVKSLGLSISETEVNAWEASKQLQLRTSYSDSLTASLNSAQGKDYLNSAQTVAQQVAAARGNIDGLWGGDAGRREVEWAKVVETNRAGAQKVIDDAGLLGSAFTDLTSAFSEALRKAGVAETDVAALTAGLHESAAAHESATQAQEDLQKRLLTAQVGAGQAAQAQLDAYATEVSRRRELAAATDDATKAMLGQIYAAEDADSAVSKAAAAEKAQSDLALRLLEAQVGAGQATQAAYDAAKREADRKTELAAVTDDATKALLRQVSAAQDLATASEAAKTALEAERQVRADSASLLERAYKAVGRDYRAALTALDQQQQTELRTAIAGGTTDIGLLLRTQAVERAQAEVGAVSSLLDKQIAARQAEVAAIRETVESAKSLRESLLTAADAMALDSSLSPLSPLDLLNEARRQWSESVAAARGGDTEALGRLEGLGRSYVEASKAYYASSDRSAYDEVQAVWRDLGANGTDQLDAQQSLVDAADAQIEQLQALKATAERSLAAQLAVPVSIADLSTALSGAVDRLTEANDNLSSVMAGKSVANDNSALMQALFGNGPGNAAYGVNAELRYTDGQGRSMGADKFYQLAYASGFSGPSVGHGEISAALAADSDLKRRLDANLDLYWQAQAAGLVGKIPGYEDGGVVGNGLWGRDSVIARYAGGGHIALAGGEYVMPADMTAAYRPALDAMRAGVWELVNANWQSPANDPWSVAAPEVRSYSAPAPPPPNRPSAGSDGMKDVVAELRAMHKSVVRENAELRKEVAALRAVTAGGAIEVKGAVEKGNANTADMASAARRQAAARKAG